MLERLLFFMCTTLSKMTMLTEKTNGVIKPDNWDGLYEEPVNQPWQNDGHPMQ